jgi:hypothetical protein
MRNSNRENAPTRAKTPAGSTARGAILDIARQAVLCPRRMYAPASGRGVETSR